MQYLNPIYITPHLLGTKFKFNLKSICFVKETLTDYIFPKS